MIIDVNIQPQFQSFFNDKLREVSCKSGRSAGKSYAAADHHVTRSYNNSRHRVIACVREIQKSIDKSVYPLLQERVFYYNMQNDFRFLRDKIINIWTNNVFLFFGLKDQTAASSFKSTYGITDCWVEEAQSLSHQSLDILMPTIREQGSRTIYTWNTPPNGFCAISDRFEKNNLPPKSYHFFVSWENNKYLSEDTKEVIEYDFKTDEKLARHIWGGETFPIGHRQIVFPLAWIDKIFEYSSKLTDEQIKTMQQRLVIEQEFQPVYFAGFDLADQGEDTNAVVLVSGNMVHFIDEWRAQFTGDSVFKVHNICKQKYVQRVDYDATGMGSSARSDFAKYADDYSAIPFMAGGRAEGYDRQCLRNVTNGQFFKNKKAQAYWAVRLAMERTIKMIEGEPDDNVFNYYPGKHFLFFSKDVMEQYGNKLKQELVQIEYQHDEGKLSIDKKPNNNKSPNLVDALIMAYSYRIDNGLRL